MRQNNWYTKLLFLCGLLSMLALVNLFFREVNWNILLLILLLTILIEMFPIQFSKGFDYSVSLIGSTFLLYKVGMEPAYLVMCCGAIVYYLRIGNFNCFKFFATLGMYFISILTTYAYWSMYGTGSVYIDIPLLIVIFDLVNFLLRIGIMKTVLGEPIFQRPNQNAIKSSAIASLLSSMFTIQLLLAQGTSALIWNLTIVSFSVILLSYLTSTNHKQIVDIEENSQRLKSLYENNPDIVLTVDTKGTILATNPMLERVLGYKSNDVINQSIFELLAEEGQNDFSSDFPKIMEGNARIIQAKISHFDKTRKDFSVVCVPTVLNNHVVGAYIIGKDVTLEKEAARVIQTMAYYDSITGLMNRVLMMDRLHTAIREAEDKQHQIGVLFIDFDHFKAVNDTFGHSMGDMLLIKVAQKLREISPPEAMVARLGGDEFLIILPSTSEQECRTLSKQLLRTFEHSIMLGEQPVYITPSIGVSLYPEQGVSAEQLVSRADAAMYRAKNEGGSSYRLFTPDMQKEHEDNRLISMMLRTCIENNEMWLQYQPQVDIKTGQIIGAEALARWTSPTLGNVSPGRFIPIAEQNNLILSIGSWILRSACEQNKKWQLEGYPPVKMAVNISSIQLQQENFVEMVQDVLKETGLDPQWLELELTESVLIQNTSRNFQILQDLRQLGVKIAVDDFGVGYSSLSYLNRFSLDYLKIDRSFVQNIGSNPSDEAIIRMIIRLANDLGLKVVAEGIETEEQYAFVKAESCDYIQGYYYSKPLPSDEWVRYAWGQLQV